MLNFKGLFSGIEIKQKIVTPVLSNLMTALILFLVALLFKPLIFSLFSSKEIKDFPIYCILEPFNYNSDSVAVDVFIINLIKEKQTKESLSEFVKLNSSDNNSNLNADIHISQKNGLGEISSIKVDKLHNQGIGSVNINKSSDGWNIIIDEIEGNSFLKLTIFTTIKRKIISRGSQGSNPIQITYPGRI